MASTTFIDQQTVILASWLNDVNNTVYNGNFPNGTINPTTVNCTTLSATNATITNATITNLTANIGTLNLTNNWQIVAGASKLSFINNGTTVATIDTSGNIRLLASSITGTTP
jgi:hypothetical protein